MRFLPQRRASSLLGAFVAVLAGGCFGGGPAPRTAPLPELGTRSAYVIFLRENPAQWRNTPNPFNVHVFDEQGYVLGLLKRGSWFVVERPPGRQAFFATAGPTCVWKNAGRCRTATSATTAVRADLQPGRVYVLGLRSRVARPLSIREAFAAMRGPCAVELDALQPIFLTMVSESPRNVRWLLDSADALEAAPQQLEHYELDGAEVVRVGRQRLENRCNNAGFVAGSDGLREWPFSWTPPVR
ncbi:MAG: hypothetical protein AAF411_02740 [Myxococcota bacterium]